MRSPRNLLISLIICCTLMAIAQSTDFPVCHADDRAVLLQIKAKIANPNASLGSLDDWQPDTDCCWWNFVGCLPDGTVNTGRVNAVTISSGSGLVGQIPDEIGDLPFLEEIMFIDEPRLTGTLPQSMSKLKRLQIIYLSSNNLSGPIPEFLGRLKNLQEVDLSGNKFSGVIPPSLSRLSKLSSFNVSRNVLAGSIPKMQTKKLTTFDVSFNQLCGAIPAELSKFNSTSFAHNKCLCGSPMAACK